MDRSGALIDSSVLIRAERQKLNASQLIEEIHHELGDQRLAISSVALTECLHGVFHSSSAERFARQTHFFDALLDALPVLPFTKDTAILAARIGGEQAAKGFSIPPIDLLIGATALERNFAVLTTNERHFRMVPGLVVIPF